MKLRKLLTLALCVAALVCSLSMTAYAVEPEGDTPAADTGDEVEVETTETTTTIQEITGGLDSGNTLTPDGAGTVLDNATDADGKEFFTVTTEDGAVFYLVVDRQKADNNVYFLNAVTLEDLTALAQVDGGTLTGLTTQDTQATEEPTAADPAASPEPSSPAQTETPQQTSPVNIGMLVAALAALAVGGVAGWYFKIYRPKRQKSAELEDYPEDEEDDPLDIGPAWDEDGDGQE